jgi:alpha-D-xyloside xylohydrolase
VFHDGLRDAGETDIVMLPRAGWVGTWRWGAALWSGDIGTTMEVLKSQVNIGLSAQASGIPWWTTDIGGCVLFPFSFSFFFLLFICFFLCLFDLGLFV